MAVSDQAATPPERFDVIVVGSGNAAFSAAHAAREKAGRVCMLEKAPRDEIGGNSYFTVGSFRTSYTSLEDLRPLLTDVDDIDLDRLEVDAYPEEAFLGDLRRVTHGRTDPTLSDLLVREARPTMEWLRSKGLRWTLQVEHQSFEVGGKRRLWGGGTVATYGGGFGLVDQHLAAAQASGIELRTDHRVVGLVAKPGGGVGGVVADTPEGRKVFEAPSVILACGGFGADARMRAMYLGKDWDKAKVRGTRHNTGDGIVAALEVGAQPFGHWSGCHAVQWDANAPTFGDRVLTNKLQRHSYPYGLMINAYGERFVDEGEDFRNYTYARMGREVLAQPGGVAYQLFDQRMRDYMRTDYDHEGATKVQADTVDELAERLGLPVETLTTTVREYNAAVQDGEFNPTILDGKSTKGLEPPKSNWALALQEPPFIGVSVVCAITFTFGGVRIDPQGCVLDGRDEPIAGLYAAGEMVGGLFYDNYPGGSGLMAGSVFGYRAGHAAAARASSAERHESAPTA